MSAIPSVRRRRTATVGLLGAAVLVLLGVLVYSGAKALVRYEGAKDASVDAEKMQVTPVGMLASVDNANRLTSIAVFVWKPAEVPGGSIVTVPVSSDTAGGVDDQRIPLAQVYEEGGAEALVPAVESVLSLTIDQYLVATPQQLSAALTPVEPIAVELPKPVREVADDGTVTPLFPAGTVALTGTQAAQVLNAHDPDVFEAQRRPLVEAVWAGVAAAVGEGRMTAPDSPVPTTFDDVLARIYAGPAAFRGLPAVPLPDGESSLGRDVEVLDRAEAVLVFASIAPSNVSAASTGLSFEVIAPRGYDDKVKSFVAALLYLGANVQRVYLDGPSQTATVLSLADARFRELTAGAEALVGSVTLQDPAVRLEGIDVTFVLGTDYLNRPIDGTLPSTSAPTTLP
jgi:hypothetical protein